MDPLEFIGLSRRLARLLIGLVLAGLLVVPGPTQRAITTLYRHEAAEKTRWIEEWVESFIPVPAAEPRDSSNSKSRKRNKPKRKRPYSLPSAFQRQNSRRTA